MLTSKHFSCRDEISVLNERITDLETKILELVVDGSEQTETILNQPPFRAARKGNLSCRRSPTKPLPLVVPPKTSDSAQPDSNLEIEGKISSVVFWVVLYTVCYSKF